MSDLPGMYMPSIFGHSYQANHSCLHYVQLLYKVIIAQNFDIFDSFQLDSPVKSLKALQHLQVHGEGHDHQSKIFWQIFE